MTGGRDTISARAMEKIARAVAADEFEVDVAAVSAELADHGGELDLAIRTPVRAISIGRAQAEPGAVTRAGGSVLERAERGEVAIAGRVEQLTGSAVSRVDLRFTGVSIKQERRVR